MRTTSLITVGRIFPKEGTHKDKRVFRGHLFHQVPRATLIQQKVASNAKITLRAVASFKLV
jgi:hypothetical protein